MVGIIKKEGIKLAKNTGEGFINYILVNFFGNHYKKYLTKSLILKGEAEYEAKKGIIEKIGVEPNKALSLLGNEAELDYRNMAGVLMKAKDKIKENAEGNIDLDKMKRLKDLSKEYSSDEMQEYIAKILAGEYNKPGTYSLQTMEIIKTLSKEELEIFYKFKAIVFFNYYLPESLFSDFKLMEKFNINYNELLLLNSLNLISVNSSAISLSDLENKILSIDYNGKRLGLKYKGEKKVNSLYFLTRAGKELYGLLDNNYNHEFVDYLKDFFKGKGVELIIYDK